MSTKLNATLPGEEAAGRADTGAQRIKKALYFLTVIVLFGTTFIPHAIEWKWWNPWVNGYVALLSKVLVLVDGFLLLCIFRKVRAAMGYAGRQIKRIHALPEPVLLAISATVFFCLTYYLSGKLFSHLPTEVDSMAQYAGAKIFAQGHWTLPSHMLPQFFDTHWFFNDGKFYTFYPPGHMMLLAIGHLIGNPAIVNPLMTALAMLATYFLAKEIGGVSTARISLVLFLVSPFIVFLASEFDNRSTALLAATLFSLFYVKALKYGRPLWGLVSGVALGYLIITRPQTAVPYALPFAVYSAWVLCFDFRNRWKIFSAMIAGIVPFILFFLYYNWQTTGSPLLTGYQKYFGQEVVPGSGFNSLESWKSWPQEFCRVVIYMRLFHTQFFGWPVSSLFLGFALFMLKAQKHYCGLLVAAFFCVFFSLTLTPYTLIIFGPRYLYETSSIVLVLSALCLSRIPSALRAGYNMKLPLAQWRGILAAVILFLACVASCTDAATLYHKYGNNYRFGNVGFANLIEESVQKPALVLIGDDMLYDGLTYMQPTNERSGIIIAHDLGAENQKIMDFYPNRSVYIVTGIDAIKRLR